MYWQRQKVHHGTSGCTLFPKSDLILRFPGRCQKCSPKPKVEYRCLWQKLGRNPLEENISQEPSWRWLQFYFCSSTEFAPLNHCIKAICYKHLLQPTSSLAAWGAAWKGCYTLTVYDHVLYVSMYRYCPERLYRQEATDLSINTYLI
jgi:hypothetical protein